MDSFKTQIVTLCRAHPRQALGILLGLGILGALAVGAMFVGTVEWHDYELVGTMLTVELPAEPKASGAKLGGDIGALYLANSKYVAVLASGGPVPAGETADAHFIVEQAMDLVRKRPGVKDLKYQVGHEHINGQPCLLVAGAFKRNDAPAHLSGAFFVGKSAHAHVLCFWSDPKGAANASRILHSIRLGETAIH